LENVKDQLYKMSRRLKEKKESGHISPVRNAVVHRCISPFYSAESQFLKTFIDALKQIGAEGGEFGRIRHPASPEPALFLASRSYHTSSIAR
jgi:hypothetical protein